MQQFFWLLNRFLADEAATARRSLSIKTYTVGGWSWSWLGWGGSVWLAWRGKLSKASTEPEERAHSRCSAGAAKKRGRRLASRHWLATRLSLQQTPWPPLQVVPFSPASGLLEWVEDTVPLGDYLVGKTRTGGAHMRYQRPGDYSFTEVGGCRCRCRGGRGGGRLAGRVSVLADG